MDPIDLEARELHARFAEERGAEEADRAELGTHIARKFGNGRGGATCLTTCASA